MSGESSPNTHLLLAAQDGMVDISGLIKENESLRNEKNALQSKLEKLQQEYCEFCKTSKAEKDWFLSNIDELKAENKKLKEENEDLKRKLHTVETELKETKTELKETKTELKETKTKLEETTQGLKKLENAREKDHYRLLLGSIAYNFVDCVGSKVFGNDRWRNLRRQLHSLDDIRQHAQHEEEQKKFEHCIKDFNNDHEDLLFDFTSGRLSLAHPTSVDPSADEDEPCATPDQLEKVVEHLFRSKKSKKKREIAGEMINRLDALSRELGRPLLV